MVACARPIRDIDRSRPVGGADGWVRPGREHSGRGGRFIPTHEDVTGAPEMSADPVASLSPPWASERQRMRKVLDLRFRRPSASEVLATLGIEKAAVEQHILEALGRHGA